MRQLTLDVRPDCEPSFDNYVAGGNAALVEALRFAIEQDFSLVYLWGERGSGRSHLLRAAVCAASGLSREGRHANACDFAAFVPTPGELIAIDDVELLDAEAQANLFRVLIGASENRNTLILAGIVPPQALRLREDVRTRIGQGLVFAIQPLSDSDKATLLRTQASQRGIALEEDIIEYLLRHGRRDLPWLMAVLDALDEASLTEGRRITLPLVRELLRDACEPELPFNNHLP